MYKYYYSTVDWFHHRFYGNISLILGSETVITVGIVIGLPVQATATAYPPGFFCVFFLLARNARKVQETMPRRKKRKTNRKKQPPKKKKSTARSRARDKKLEQLTVGAIWRVSTSDTVTTSTGKEKLSGWQNCRILSVTTGTCRSVQDRRLLAREKISSR